MYYDKNLRGCSIETSHKTIWILIGPNGAGKTTFAMNPPEALQELRYTPYINPDSILKKHAGLSISGDELDILTNTSNEIENLIARNLSDHQSFIIEKVMPTLAFVNAPFTNLQDQGWKISTIAVGLDNADLSKKRVKDRVTQGGHNVRWDLATIFSKHVSQLPELLTLSDSARIYDNSGNGYELLAQKQGRGIPLEESHMISGSQAAGSSYLREIMKLSAPSPALAG